jgi:outer membrane receptor protein involved in Fe transport
MLRTSAVVALAFTAVTSFAGAQGIPVVRGRVVDATAGQPIADAVVRSADDARFATRSAADGRFALRTETASSLIVMRLGFAPETVAVAATSIMEVRLRPAAISLNPAMVQAERALSSASSFTIRQLDIELRPRESAQEILRLAPGLVIAQHAGGGKAEQIFFRGFDADHGTDVAVSVDGTPVNMVSHAHGQGYADLHFLIPQVVERADVRKGPFDVQDGNLATAGAVALRTKDRIDAARGTVRGGSFSTIHAIGLVPFGGDVDHSGGYVAASLDRSDGPFQRPQNYRRANGFVKWTAPVSFGQLVATASAFDSKWDASGQVPNRAVAGGTIDRFGAIDPTEGGTTSRYEASLALRSRGDAVTRWNARAFVARYDLDLFSNFTFFADDTVNGDGIEQLDDRTIAGVRAQLERPARSGVFRAGFETRFDDANVLLAHQRERTRLDRRSDAGIGEAHHGAWLAQSVQLGSRTRLELGLRGDGFRFGVDDIGLVEPAFVRESKWVGILSPRANLAVDVADGTTLFVNAGTGFHSNDGRSRTAARGLFGGWSASYVVAGVNRARGLVARSGE